MKIKSQVNVLLVFKEDGSSVLVIVQVVLGDVRFDG